MTSVTFGELLPDQPGYQNPGVIVADGVLPKGKGYGPFPGFTGAGNATLADTCLGAAATRAIDGSAIVVAGTASDLYRYEGLSTGWASKASGLSASTSVGWRFMVAGSRFLATNGVDPIQSLDLTSPGSFADLDASAPTARYLAVVREFTVAGFAAGVNLRVQWSNRSAPTSWTPGGSSLAGSADMSRGGDIQAVIGGEYGIILQETRVVVMRYTNDPDDPFQFDEISGNIGCIAPWSVARYDRLVFFLSEQGFMVCDGNSVTPIGKTPEGSKIDETFLAASDRAFFPAMSAVTDPRSSRYLVALPSASPTTTIYCYDFILGKWSTAQIAVERLLVGMSQAATLEDLDGLYASLDAMTTSLDDPQFRAGNPAVYAIDSTHTLGSLSGLPLAATITTGDLEFVSGRRSRVSRVRPLTDAAAPGLSIAGRNTLAGALTTTAYDSLNRAGEFSARQNWAFQRHTLSIPAGASWTYALGLDVEAQDGGRP